MKPKACDYDPTQHNNDYAFYLKGKIPKPEDAHAVEQYTKYTHDCPGEILEEFDETEEHTSELQSHSDLVSRLLLEKKNFSLSHC